MKIVINSTPLIFLGKVNKLNLLTDLFKEIIVPSEVQKETVVQGKEQGFEDAFRIERFLTKETVTEMETSKEPQALNKSPLGSGEKAVISTALEKDIKTVLIDDRKARNLAEALELNPRGTLWILAKSNSQNLITEEKLKDLTLEIVGKGYRIKEEILASFLEKI